MANNNSYSVGAFKIEFESNLPEVKEELKAKKKKIFQEWGAYWLEVVVPITPKDTGDLRKAHSFKTMAQYVLLYNNKEYAAAVNNGNRGRKPSKFMERAIINKKENYKFIAEDILKE